MDIVLGVSLAPTNVRLVVIEGQNADGVTVEQDQFEVAAAEAGAVDQLIAAIDGTREGARAAGHHLISTGVTWTDPAQVGALRDAVAAHDLGTVMLVSPLLAGATLAQTVGQALGYGHIAMVFVDPGSATLAVVDVSDGSIVDLHRHQLADAPGGLESEVAGMVADLDAPGSRADGVFLVGCGTDIVPLKPALEAATSLDVTAPEEPDMALARGAALASANAPLFASTTAAMAYALDPGTGEVNPRALSPTYLDVSASAGPSADALAYSAVGDIDDGGDERRARRGRNPVVLAGGALAAAAAVAVGILVVSLASDHATVRHDPGVSAAPPGQQAPAQAPSPPPQAQVPAPTPPPPPPPTAQAAPPAPAPVEQPAPPPVSAPPAAPVYRTPPQRRAPQSVPTPVQEAPAPPPQAPAPPVQQAPPPAPPPQAPQAPQQPPMTMYLHFPFVTVPIPITPPAPPPPAP